MRSVALVVQEGVELFGMGSMIEVFGERYHPEDDNPVFDFRICTPFPGLVPTEKGIGIQVEHGLDAAADVDLLLLAPKRDFEQHAPEVLELAREAVADDRMVMAHCTGAFALAQAGVLDGRRATTHWRYAERMAAHYPRITVEADRLYVHDGPVLTGAGSAAGLDAALYLLRQTHGAKAANDAARRIVLPPHRDGGQAQFVRQPVPECTAETLGPLLTWITGNLDADLSVATLARQVSMSERTFARRFGEETGTTPHQWITHQRVRLAEELLERSDLPVERVADRVGFGSPTTFRQQFVKVRGISPQAYRRQFNTA